MRKIQDIINNQNLYRDNILKWLSEETKKTKDILRDIKTSDEFIKNEKKKLINKFKKIDVNKYHERLFFMHPRRNKEFYVWWNVDNEEALIYRYDQE